MKATLKMMLSWTISFRLQNEKRPVCPQAAALAITSRNLHPFRLKLPKSQKARNHLHKFLKDKRQRRKNLQRKHFRHDWLLKINQRKKSHQEHHLVVNQKSQPIRSAESLNQPDLIVQWLIYRLMTRRKIRDHRRENETAIRLVEVNHHSLHKPLRYFFFWNFWKILGYLGEQVFIKIIQKSTPKKGLKSGKQAKVAKKAEEPITKTRSGRTSKRAKTWHFSVNRT